MIEDIYIFYIFSNFKLGLISRLKLMEHLKNYVKSKGQIFIKMAQIFMTNQYLFGDKFSSDELAEMNKILDNVHQNVEDADFLVGCGSVAYVSFKKDDNNIVIKNVLPNIEEEITNSSKKFISMINIAKLSINIQVDFDSINDYKNLLLKQVDLRDEAINMIRMRNIFSNVDYINIPKIHSFEPDYIEMDYIKGLKLSEFIKEYPNKRKTCLLLLNKVLKIMIENKFFHGDLHEGNFIFYLDENYYVHISIIDFGIVFELDAKQQKTFYNYIVLKKESCRYRFFYELCNKEIPLLEFKILFEKHRHDDIFKIFDKMKEENVKFNFFYTTFLIGLNNLILLLNK